MNHLFSKPVQYILAMDRGAIHCWIKSVEEARLTRMHAESITKDSILQFLRPRSIQKIETKPSDRSNSHQEQSNAAQGPSTRANPAPTPQQSSSTTTGQAIIHNRHNSKRLPLVPQKLQRNLRQDHATIGAPKRDRLRRRKHDKLNNAIRECVKGTCRRQADSDAIP